MSLRTSPQNHIRKLGIATNRSAVGFRGQRKEECWGLVQGVNQS